MHVDRRSWVLLSLGLAGQLAGCNCGTDEGPSDSGAGGGGGTVGVMDAGPGDGGRVDAGLDAGPPDAGPSDAGVDAGLPDAGPSDAGVDAGLPDAGVVDAGTPWCGAVDGGPLFLGPLRYRQAADSPFPCAGATVFMLDTLEDDRLDLPGVTTNATFTYPSFGSITDSVDFDDGVLDNDCYRADAGRYCQSHFASGPTGISFTFSTRDGGFLGQLPSFAGLVWTDGEGRVRFEAFGPDGGSLGVLGPFDPADAGFPGTGVTRETDEDRFFGVVHLPGISRIVVSNSSGGIEVDHPQAGR